MLPVTAMMPRTTSVLPALLIVPSLSLLIAYLWARATRPDLPPWEASGYAAGAAAQGDLGRYVQYPEDDDTSFSWPAWYGGSQSTPYDYTPPSRLADAGLGFSKGLRILVDADLSPRSELLPYTLSLLDAIRTTGEADIYVPRADRERTPQDDLETDEEQERREQERWDEQCKLYDLIWRIEDISLDGRSGVSAAQDSDLEMAEEAQLESARRQSRRRHRRTCGDVPILSDSMRAETIAPGALDLDESASITLLANPNQMLANRTSYPSLKKEHGDDWEMGLYAHILQAADPRVYYPKSRITRRTVTYFPPPTYAYLPKANRPVFPYDARWDVHVPRVLPDKLLRRVKSGKGRPWYDESTESNGKHEVRNWVRREEERRAGKMRRSGLCLFDSWTEGLTFEMAQAMLSGCVVVGTVPDIKREQFKGLILPLEPNAQFNETNPAIPVLQIEHVLRQTKTTTLDRMALRAFTFARRELVLARKVEDVKDLLRVWQRGGRGYQFTSGFRWTCSTPTGPNGELPPWCPNDA